jgi:hypothetical protein
VFAVSWRNPTAAQRVLRCGDDLGTARASRDLLFSRPRALTILGIPIDLSEVKCDKYVLAGITDHITPWKGVYDTARLFGGETRFVVSSSGHIQSPRLDEQHPFST